MAKSKNKKKKKLGTLLLLLFLSVILLSTSTYAWFTANKNVQVADINVNVAAQGGIQISTDATNWKTVISNDDITGANAAYGAAVNQLPTTLVATSSAGLVKGGKMEMYKGTVAADDDGDFALTATKDVELHQVAGDFIAFDLFIKSESTSLTPINLYLEPGSGAQVTAGASSKGLEYATRIAVINEGSTTDTVTPKTAQDLVIADSDGLKATIYEPNFEGHTAYGITQANAYYKDAIPAASLSALSAGEGNAKIPTEGVLDAITTPIKLVNTNVSKNSSYFAATTTTELPVAFTKNSGTPAPTKKVFATISKGITKFRIYMWIEGQDVDCENNASGSDITFKLLFSID